MSNKYKYLLSALMVLGSVIALWFLICNLEKPQPAPFAFVLCVGIGFYLTLKVFKNDFLNSTKEYFSKWFERKYFIIIALSTLTVIGLLARLFFFYRFTYDPISDPAKFLDSAMKLAAGENLNGNLYVAFHPYLSAYNNILGLAMRLVASPWLATILLNSIIDLASASLVFIFIRKLDKLPSHLPLIAFGAWFLNPLNIIFSVISIPVVVVNLFIILAILISYHLLQQFAASSIRNSLLLSLVLGLVIGLGNCFRPIFIVVIIGLALIALYLYLTKHKSKSFLGLFIGCLLVSTLILFGIQNVNLAFVSNQTSLRAASNPSGWSMYVGSDWGTFGQWRPYQNFERADICKEVLAKGDQDACHDILRQKAIKRYKDYGILKSTNLFIRKLYHQSEKQNYFYNAEQSITGYKGSRTSKVISISMIVYMIVVFSLSAKYMFKEAERIHAGNATDPITVFLVLIMIGWFFSMLLVESAPRYSTVMYPMFIVFATLSLRTYYPITKPPISKRR